jgi:hypothetical protein
MNDKEYLESLKNYTETINLSIKISRHAANRQVEDKIVWACVLYTKLCVTGFSVLILAPSNNIAIKKIDHWDFSSLFSLTRNIMECYQTLFYLCVDKVSSDELLARRKQFNLHDYYSRKTLLSYIGTNKENKEIEDFVIKELKETQYFKALDEKRQKHFLKGDNAFFISREEIEEKTGSDKNQFKYFYKLFSSNTHTFPMGFYNMLNGERGRGVKTNVEIKYSCLALEIAEQYLIQASSHMIDFFPDINKYLTDKEKNKLNKNYGN